MKEASIESTTQILEGPAMYLNINIFFLFLTLVILSFSLTICTSSVAAAGFNYEEGSGKGPKDWSQINPLWKTCGKGKWQSPIDIQEVKLVSYLGKLKTNYKPGPAKLKNRGYHIAVSWKGDAGKIDLNKTSYKLLQCHWHTPSEHTVNGKSYDMELHIVHENSQGKKAVIGVLYRYGLPDPFLARMIRHIGSVGEEKDVGIVHPEDINFGTKEYFRYIGSLTTPPCAEPVTWTIVKEVKTVSREQVRALKHALHTGFKENARPTQKLKGRRVWFQTPI